MKQTFITLLIFFVCCAKLFSQEKDLVKIADSISNEGKTLFKSEWASWYGTDIFMDKCKDKHDQIGGYVSYDTGKGLNNIFFSKGPDPVVLGTTSFGYDFNQTNYTLDTVSRKLNAIERRLYTIRQAAIKRINSDTLFKSYKNTSLNPVPIINNGISRVYVLTGPHIGGVVVIGNDYLIDFNGDSIETVKRIHKNIIPINYKNATADSNKTALTSIHTHLPETGEFITATDICTLMLYEKFTPWTQHIVVSKNYISFWDCKKNSLFILTMEAWKRIEADQKMRHPSNSH